MTIGKQSVKKAIWYFRRKKPRIKTKRGQKRGTLPIGLIAFATTPLLSEVAKPIFKTIFGRGKRRRIRR